MLFSWWHELRQPLLLLLVLPSLLPAVARAWNSRVRRAGAAARTAPNRSTAPTATATTTGCFVLAPKLSNHGVAVRTHRHGRALGIEITLSAAPIAPARQRQSLILAPPAPRRVLHELRGALLLRRPPHQLRALVRRRVAALIVTEDDSVR